MINDAVAPVRNSEKIGTYFKVDPINYKRRESFEVSGIGSSHVPVVVADYSSRKISSQKDLTDIGYKYDEPSDKWFFADAAADIIYLEKKNISFTLPENLKLIIDYDEWIKLDSKKLRYPLFHKDEYLRSKTFSGRINFLAIKISDFDEELSKKIKLDEKLVLVIETDNEHGMAEQRRFFFELINAKLKILSS